jgi:enamine deaminase RidA (YjgF/YER057c/UK114 family)
MFYPQEDNMQRQSVPAGTIWGEGFGYSRAVRVGKAIHVSGTAASDEEGQIHGRGDVYAQTAFALSRIESALDDLGASIEQVVRTRVYVTDMDSWKQVAQAHAEFFAEIKPASTLVEVSRLIDPELLVEIEAMAIVA